MVFNHHTDSEKDSPNQEPDTALSAVIIIATMIPVECLKCFSHPLFYADLCLQLMLPRSSASNFSIRLSMINI